MRNGGRLVEVLVERARLVGMVRGVFSQKVAVRRRVW